MNDKNYDLTKFEDGDFSLDVNVSPSEDTVWLTQAQIAELYERERSVITKHIKNIFLDNELDRYLYLIRMKKIFDEIKVVMSSKYDLL